MQMAIAVASMTIFIWGCRQPPEGISKVATAPSSESSVGAGKFTHFTRRPHLRVIGSITGGRKILSRSRNHLR
jgi:hypothetical protein